MEIGDVLNMEDWFTVEEIDDYQLFKGTPELVFRDGYCFDLGNRKLTVVHTPGHSQGHCCFYEPERQYSYSGDLIYRGCLDAFYPTTDPQLTLRKLNITLPSE